TNANPTLQYTPAMHRAVIALRCAMSKRPFNIVNDPYYKMEVELLRPGTIVPHPSTVSRDICAIYSEAAKHVREYFEVGN
ncbi:hypothetical protein BOTBODRAFT_102100, partial [Botryobasidium botryosum FD-172 SS1]